jgi:hypothetical protein
VFDRQSQIVQRIGSQAPGPDHSSDHFIVKSGNGHAGQHLAGGTVTRDIAQPQLRQCECMKTHR